MAEKDYYKILGVSKNATKEEIRSAYKKLAKQHHPDVNKEVGSSEKFKEISEAASVLADDNKRQQYDQFGSDFERKYHQDFSRTYSNFDFDDMDFGDVFEMFFGGSSARGRHRQKGSDLRFNIEISLEDAGTGIKQEITVQKPEVCKDCDGKGGDDYESCTKCNGKGFEKITQRTPFGIFASSVTCRKCEGRGEIIKNTCSKCKGHGIIDKNKTLELNIPAGVDSGAQLRLKGEGEAVKNGTTGDLYVFINVKKHKYFDREEDDILLDVPITITQAILGDEIEVPTLDGKAMLKIPKGTQPETVFRMHGKGIKHLSHHSHGDELITIKIQIPEKLNKKQGELIKEFAKESGKPKSFFEKLFK